MFPKKFIRDKTEDLGRGTFGAVIKYKIVNDVLWGNKDVAIKILDSKQLIDSKKVISQFVLTNLFLFF